MKPLIIGQAPARGNDDKPPFSGQSGARLARLAGVGVSGDVLPEHFDLINLIEAYPGKKGRGDYFDMATAREAAMLIRDRLRQDPPRLVLLMGRKVKRAMGVNGDVEYLEWFNLEESLAACFPHPSGLNHWWNEPGNVGLAQGFLRGVLYRADHEGETSTHS
jgi:uracil-DNA glycosylase